MFRPSLAAAACLTLATLAHADEIKMGYINKMGEHPWFVAEVGGAKAEASKLGVKADDAGRAVQRRSRR